jgi:hypothetical protein
MDNVQHGHPMRQSTNHSYEAIHPPTLPIPQPTLLAVNALLFSWLNLLGTGRLLEGVFPGGGGL